MYKLSKLNWTNTLFLLLSPLVAAGGLWLYLYLESFQWSMIALFFFFYFITGFSITAGYHRLISHRAYKAYPIIKALYLIFGAAAFQNSALKWCQDHRNHHKKVDSDGDPYNPKKGFFYSHMGWILLNENSIDKYDKDLENDALIQWQHKYYMLIAILAGIALPMLIGHMLGSSLGGFVFGAALRIVFTHHCTFFINSLAHIWGKQPYTSKNSARDNLVLAFFTYGEGYHNFHHRFEGDYRNGIKWYHYDPTKWLIQCLERLGFAYKLKTVSQEEILKAKLRATNLKINTKYSEKLKEECFDKLEFLRQKVEEKQRAFRKLHTDYLIMKKQMSDSGRDKIIEMKQNLKWAKQDFQTSYKEWKGYIRSLSTMVSA